MAKARSRAPRFGSPAHLELLQEGRYRLSKMPTDRRVREYLEGEIRATEEQLGIRPRQGDLFGFDYDGHHLKLELSYDELLVLASMLDRWVTTGSIREDLSRVSEALRSYASEVGIGWQPATPRRLSLMAFMARTETASRLRGTKA